MPDGWRRAPLGRILALDIEQVTLEPGTEYAIVGVLNKGRGLLHRDAITSVETQYPKLNRVRGGQLVYSKLKAFEGSVTVVPRTDLAWYASPEFPTFTCTEFVMPEFLALVTTMPAFWGELAEVSKGLGGRRERVHPRDFLALSVLLPPVPDQRRIVDLVGALDEAIEAADDSWLRLRKARADAASVALSLDRHRVHGWEVRKLGDVAEFLNQKRKPITEKDRQPGTTPYYGANGEQDRVADYLFDEVLVLLAEDGGRYDISGAQTSYLVSGKSWVNNHAHVLRGRPGFLSTEFLAVALSVADFSGFYAGSTRTKLTKAGAMQVSIPVPPFSEQDEVVSVDSAHAESIEAIAQLTASLRALRTNLLTTLLNGDHEIPSSYDKHLGAIA